jgi:hypothetical protein
MYRKLILCFSMILTLAFAGSLFAQLTFPIPEETPGIPQDESIAYKVTALPTVNADLSEWIEAGAVFKLIGAEDGSDVFRGDWFGPDDSSTLWSMMWDDDSLYFAAVIWDDIYSPVTKVDFPWEADCAFLFFDGDVDGTVDNKLCFYLYEEEATVMYLDGVEEGCVNLALVRYDEGILGEGGRFFEAAIPMDCMTNMIPASGEVFGLQVGIEEGNDSALDDQFKFYDWFGLDPDQGDNHFPVTFGGEVSVSKHTDSELPSGFTLLQNYPNPFNPTTNIKYVVEKTSTVTLTVYDLAGKEIATLVNGVQAAGEHVVHFDASHLTSGVYVYTLRSENHTLTQKMLLVK